MLGNHGHGSAHGHGHGGGHGGGHGHDVAPMEHAPVNDSHHGHISHDIHDVSNFSFRTIGIKCMVVFMINKNKKWTWTGFIMCRNDNR